MGLRQDPRSGAGRTGLRRDPRNGRKTVKGRDQYKSLLSNGVRHMSRGSSQLYSVSNTLLQASSSSEAGNQDRRRWAGRRIEATARTGATARKEAMVRTGDTDRTKMRDGAGSSQIAQ